MVSILTSNVSTSHKDVQLKKIKQGASLTLTNLIVPGMHTHNLS